jgi:hypothetical protein
MMEDEICLLSSKLVLYLFDVPNRKDTEMRSDEPD